MELKYAELSKHLKKSKLSVIRLSFKEIEDIIGFKLPPEASAENWWFNAKKNDQARAWLEAGYKTRKVKANLDSKVPNIEFHKTYSDKMRIKNRAKKRFRTQVSEWFNEGKGIFHNRIAAIVAILTIFSIIAGGVGWIKSILSTDDSFNAADYISDEPYAQPLQYDWPFLNSQSAEYNLAMSLYKQLEFPAAYDALKPATDRQAETYGPYNIDTARMFMGMAIICLQYPRYDDAIVYANKAILAYEIDENYDALTLGNANSILATAYMNRPSPQYEKADYYYNNALKYFRSLESPNREEISNTQNGIGNVLFMQGKLRPALLQYCRAVMP